MGRYSDDLGDNIACLAYLDGIADADAQVGDDVAVVQAGAGDTLVPARKIGSNTAVGVSTPVRPTVTSMSRTTLSLTSGGYLNAMAQRGNLLVTA